MTQKTILILGGTADARYLCEDLLAFIDKHKLNTRVIYSLAGLVRKTPLNCEVISGGFSQFGGLSHYLTEQGIDLIVNATHPYAAKISEQALLSSNAANIACWRLERAPWQAQAGDDWHEFADMESLLGAVADKKSVLLSAGQLSQAQIDSFTAFSGQKQLLRTAVQPPMTLPATMQWLKAIGPFSLEAETALLQNHNIDAIVSKNSGGLSTYAKIIAANRLNIPVYMLSRPQMADYPTVFADTEPCLAALQQFITEQVYVK